MVTVGIDLGGTNVNVVVLADDNEVLARAKLKTPTSGDRTHVVEVMVAGVHDALQRAGSELADVASVGVGSPGVVLNGTVGGASNLPGFLERFGLADLLRSEFGPNVRVANDVTCAAVGEHRLGAARGVNNALVIFVGTGVGGGLILNGDPYEGSFGAAGEFGHTVVAREGAVCPCGRRGCVEAYAGRRAMAFSAERAVKAGRSSILFDVQQEMGKKRTTSGVFREALDRGDTLVADLIDDAVDALGVGIASAVNLLDVEAVIIGGGLADKLQPQFIGRVDAATRPRLFLTPSRLQFAQAQLGDEGGAIGAALLSRDSVSI